MPPADRLALWGRLLWGQHWISGLADALDLNVRTVQRWAGGQGEPPEGVWNDLREKARERIAELRGLLARKI